MKYKINIVVTLDVPVGELRDELSIDKDDDVIEALHTHVVENLGLGLECGDVEVQTVEVTS